jgi:hypothetical protein
LFPGKGQLKTVIDIIYSLNMKIEVEIDLDTLHVNKKKVNMPLFQYKENE